MSAHNDIETLRRRLDTLARSVARIRHHAHDLQSLAVDPYRGEPLEGDSPGFESKVPRGGDPRAMELLNEITRVAEAVEATFLGLDRRMMMIFTARAKRPEPTRGSTISVKEFEARLAKQRQNQADGHYVPARIEGQPQHPGKRK